MAVQNESLAQAGGRTEEQLESIARSLSLLVKLAVRDALGDGKISEMIITLHSLGCRPVEIAEALGKTTNDVNPVLSRARKTQRGGKGRGRRRTKR